MSNLEIRGITDSIDFKTGARALRLRVGVGDRELAIGVSETEAQFVMGLRQTVMSKLESPSRDREVVETTRPSAARAPQAIVDDDPLEDEDGDPTVAPLRMASAADPLDDEGI